MNIGKARALFEQVASGEYHGSTVGEYLEAVKIVLDMETHNSISKKMIISVCKWLVKIAEKAVSPYRWIPVEEELPENEKDVLVTRHYLGEEDNNKSCYYTEVAARYGDDDNPDWISYSDEYKIHPKNHIVIAWQELPEPYKGGGNE
jgi:hypothetical protein